MAFSIRVLWGLSLFGALAPAAPLDAQIVELGPPPAHPPTIDGRLDEGEWAGATKLEGLVQVEPGENTPASRRTEIFLAADGRALYVAIHAYDEPGLVRATLAPRDAIDADDHVDLHLDTFGDGRRAYLIAFNPLGIQQDGVFVEGTTDPDLTVDLVVRSRGRVTADGWVVEATIPFSSLRYATHGTRPWGLHIRRVIRHLNGEIDSWRPLRRGDAGFLSQAGEIRGLTLPPVHLPVEVIPSVTTLRADARVPGASSGTERFRNGDPESQVGVTATLGLAADASLAGTWNPDFAQVEADAPVVTANQRFPIYYPEKRPFFLEGSELLATPLRIVHTRAIVDPRMAMHLTGRRQGTGFALLVAEDEAPGAIIGGSDRRQIAIGRLRRDVGANSNIGVLLTGATFRDDRNLTLSLDAALLGAHYGFRGLLTGTRTHRPFYDPDRDSSFTRSGDGIAYYAELRRTDRHWNVSFTGSGRSPDFVSEVGFTAQTNINNWTLETRWDSDRHPGVLRRWRGYFTTHASVDWQGRARYGYLWPHATLELPGLTTIDLGPYLDWQRLFEEEFGPRRTVTQAGAFFGAPTRTTLYHGAAITITTAPSSRWEFSTTLDGSWHAFDYDLGAGPRYPRVSRAALADPGAPLDPGPGATFDATASVIWRPTPPFRASLDYTKSRLRREDTGRIAYNEDLWSLVTSYRPTAFTTIRVRGDYRSSLRNLRPQILVGWTPSPGTAFYLGYNDDLNRDGYSPVTGAFQPGLHRNARVAYAKLSYLFHLTL